MYDLVQRNKEHLTRNADYLDLVARSVEDWFKFLSSPSENELSLGMAVGGSLIGIVTLIYYKPGIFGLGYWLDANHLGHGYATSACRSLIKYAKETHDAAEVWAGIKPQNSASVAVAERTLIRPVKPANATAISAVVRSNSDAPIFRQVLP